MKEIHFYADCTWLFVYCNVVTTFMETQELIDKDADTIHTTSMAHLSFNLIKKGYRIFVHKNYKCVEFKPGMDNPMNKDIIPAHDILKIFKCGYFDEMFD